MRSSNIKKIIKTLTFLSVFSFTILSTTICFATPSAEITVPENTNSSEFFQGSYGLYLKSSEKNWKDDYESLVYALKNTNQNVFGYPAMKALYVSADEADGGDGEHSRFEQLLIATEGSGIKIFAELSESHFYDGDSSTSYCANYWLKTLHENNGTTCDESLYENDPIKLKNDWLSSFKLAAQTLSKLSQKYPHLIGFHIEDFDMHVQNPIKQALNEMDEVYTKDEVYSLTRSGKDCEGCNENFKFYPTVYFNTGFGRVIAQDGYVVGQDYGSKSNVGNFIAIEMKFKTPEDLEKLNLSFFFNDSYGNYDNDAANAKEYKNKIFKVVDINGTIVSKDDVWGDQKIEFKDLAIKKELLKDTSTEELNTIKIGLYVENVDNSNKLKFMGNRYMTIWGLNLKSNNKRFEDYTISYSLPEQTDTDEDGVSDFFAYSSKDYSIASVVDGIFAVFPGDATAYNPSWYKHLLSHAKTQVNEIVITHIGNGASRNDQRYGFISSPEVLYEQIVTAKSVGVNGVVVWNAPLEMTQLQNDSGIFSEKSSKTDYDLAAYWQGYNSGLPFWYQSWDLQDATGTINLTINDNYTSGTDGENETYFVKTIKDENGVVYYRDGILGTECDGNSNYEKECPNADNDVDCIVTCEEGSDDEIISINLNDEEHDLTVSLELTEGVGSMSSELDIKVDNPDNWSFSSGTRGKCHEDTLNAIQTAYQQIADGDTEIHKTAHRWHSDTDSDGIGDCADPEPETKNVWWTISYDENAESCLAENTDSNYLYVVGINKQENQTSANTNVLAPEVSDLDLSEGTISCSNGNPDIPSAGIYIELAHKI